MEYLLRKDIASIELNFTNNERFVYTVPYKEKDFENQDNKYVYSKNKTQYHNGFNFNEYYY